MVLLYPVEPGSFVQLGEEDEATQVLFELQINPLLHWQVVAFTVPDVFAMAEQFMLQA